MVIRARAPSKNILLSRTSLLVCDGDQLGLLVPLPGADLRDTLASILERNLGLRNTTRSGGNAGELKLAEEEVVLGEGTSTLEDLDLRSP